MASTEFESPVVAKVRGYLGKSLRVTLVDDRVVTGQFICLDSFGNLLLKEASASTLSSGVDKSPEVSAATQRMGLVTVAPKHVVKAELLP